MPRAWLVKSEPDCYSFDELLADGSTAWEGVRNYQARNFMRDGMRLGDPVLFYHSSTAIPAVVGLAKVAREAYPIPPSSIPTTSTTTPSRLTRRLVGNSSISRASWRSRVPSA